MSGSLLIIKILDSVLTFICQCKSAKKSSSVVNHENGSNICSALETVLKKYQIGLGVKLNLGEQSIQAFFPTNLEIMGFIGPFF